MALLISWKTLLISSILLVLCFVCNIHGYLGPSKQPEAYFNGSSYLRLQTTISLKKYTALSFRTCSGGSLFSQQLNDDLLELSVTMEGVLFYAKTAGKQYNEKIFGNFLNNKWHTVILQYKPGNLTLQVDKEIRLLANSTYRNELLSSPGFHNEGTGVLLVGKQFNGCLLEGPSLVFDSSIIMSSHNVRFEECPIPEDSCVPKENIKDYDFCITEPCMRHGTCNNAQTGYTCTCLPRYTGKNCEFDIGNPCEKNPPVCKNGATCRSDSNGEYTCWCPPDFTGKQCEQEIITHQQCQHNPCLNGATCVDNGNGNMECLCPPGFKGLKCELNIDDCKGNPCKHGGECVDGLNNYTCQCDYTGYTGRFCEININECDSKPCHFGTCFDTYGSYLCQCLPGYGGFDCQYSLSECESQPCLNRGRCVDNPDGYKCHCPPGFGGEHCELENRQVLCDVNNCHPYAECKEFGCVCKPQYPGTYPNCSVDSICPCQNGGTCIPWNGSFNCSCLPGFTGIYLFIFLFGITGLFKAAYLHFLPKQFDFLQGAVLTPSDKLNMCNKALKHSFY